MAYTVVKNLEEFNEITKEGKVFVDFYADWCGPCQMLAPFFEQLSNEEKDVKFVKVNTDEASDVAAKFQVMSIPTLMVFENGELAKQTAGFMPKNKMAEFIK